MKDIRRERKEYPINKIDTFTAWPSKEENTGGKKFPSLEENITT